MRTWKQGRVGNITFLDSSSLYVKCLKYPLAQFYIKYENGTGTLEEFLFEAKIQKSVLRYIETIGQHELSKKEKGNEGQSSKIYEIHELQEKASFYMKERG